MKNIIDKKGFYANKNTLNSVRRLLLFVEVGDSWWCCVWWPAGVVVISHQT
jgi:hypothetical protein